MSQDEANKIAREAQRRWRGHRMLTIALPTAAALGAGAAIAVGSIPGGRWICGGGVIGRLIGGPMGTPRTPCARAIAGATIPASSAAPALTMVRRFGAFMIDRTPGERCC